MVILYYSKYSDQKKWLSIWEESFERDPFYHPGYAGLWENEHTRACTAVYEGKRGTILYPFLLRSLKGESFWKPEAGDAFDIITPYGYGGPLVTDCTVTEGTLFQEFYASFKQWAETNKVVSEFVRFSLFSKALPYYYGLTGHNNDNIVVNLKKAPEAFWTGLSYKVRKNVQAAQRHGITAIEDPGADRLDDFLEVYESTMQRRNAGSFYRFGRQWFEKLQQNLPGSCTFFYAFHESKVIAAELVLLSGTRAYSFLGGTLKSYFPLRPSDLLKYYILEWLRERGLNSFVIGGGYRPHDGIFAFKQSFAPEGIVPFHTGKMIFDKERYRLLSQGKAIDGSGFFPVYRS